MTEQFKLIETKIMSEKSLQCNFIVSSLFSSLEKTNFTNLSILIIQME